MLSLPGLDGHDPINLEFQNSAAESAEFNYIFVVTCTCFHPLLDAKSMQATWVQDPVFLNSAPWTSNLTSSYKLLAMKMSRSSPDLLNQKTFQVTLLPALKQQVPYFCMKRHQCFSLCPISTSCMTGHSLPLSVATMTETRMAPLDPPFLFLSLQSCFFTTLSQLYGSPQEMTHPVLLCLDLARKTSQFGTRVSEWK